MRLSVFASALIAFALACSGRSVPDPRSAAEEYAQAASRGDGDAIYEMMTTSAQKSRSRDDVKRLVAEQRGELAEQAKSLTTKDARVEAVARLRYEDGEEAQLELREGHFWITSSGALPGGSRTPEQALDQLRRVLARRSYAGLMRVLTPATRGAVEQDLRSLVSGLERPETLHVDVAGDGAVVTIPGGHSVKLKREGGVWRVDDFD
jgi:hypothetical protein